MTTFRLLLGPSLIVLGVLTAAGLASLSPGGFMTLYVGIALGTIAVPYTIVALVVTMVGRLRIGPLEPGPGQTGEFDRQVVRFERFSQRASLVLAVALLALLLGMLLVTAAAGTGVDGLRESFAYVGGAVVAGALFTIVANVPQLYRPRVIAAERWALTTRSGAWLLILATRILSPLLWVCYSTTVAALLLSQ
jgi:hypothetical protein